VGRTVGGDEAEDELILSRLNLRCLSSRHLGSVSGRYLDIGFWSSRKRSHLASI